LRVNDRALPLNGTLAEVVRGQTPTLDAIADDPQLTADLSPDAARALWLRAHVALGALAPLVASPVPCTSETGEERLLTVDEAAAKLGMTKDWLYRKAARLPFTVRPSPGTLRFSSLGIERYIRQRQGR
jgi:predicted DNA-binding transcriptional regulator AlpA